MKKIAKLSLVAAVAVVGFTSANATALEEAIKGVDISGTAAYRYDDRSNANYDQGNSYKVAVNLKSSINDDLTFNVRTIVGKQSTNDMVSLKTDTSDGNADVSVSQANFAYTGIMNTTVIAGKQAVPSPFAVQVDAAGDEDTGSGITAITAAGPVTIAATYLNQTNLATAGMDIAGLGLMGNAGPVALDAWYLQAMETNSANDDSAGLYTLGAKAKVEMVDLTARYSAVDYAASGDDTENLWKVGAKAKLGIVSVSVDYGQTNDSSSLTAGTDKNMFGLLTGDADADVNLQAWALNLSEDDASLVKASLGVDVLSNVNLSATYAAQTVGDNDNSEYYGQLTYKMGKNFMTYARMGQVDMDANTEKDTRGRLHVQYTF
jgi:ACT domain-containing protein